MANVISAETDRINELRTYAILDSPTEAEYDQFADFSSRLCNTPAAVISLVDENRQWFKAVKGLNFKESARTISFCSHVVESHANMMVSDTLLDPRFKANPLVTAIPGVRFYAGIPIISPRGFVLGAIAVLDFVPRVLDATQIISLEILAEQILAKLELRRHQVNLEALNSRHDALKLNLEMTRQRLLDSYEHISDGFFLLDRNWKFTFINGVAAALTRRNIAELIGVVFWDAFPFLLDTPIEKTYRQALVEQIPVEFEQLYEPWGRWLEIRVFPSKDGLAVYFHDITKRHRSEEQLKLLENCVGHLNDVVMITEFDPQGINDARISYVNSTFQRRTGFLLEESIGKTPHSLLRPPLPQQVGVTLAQVAQEPHLSGRREFLHMAKSGRPFWVEQETVAVSYNDEAATHFVCIARDITDRKQKEIEAAGTNLAL